MAIKNSTTADKAFGRRLRDLRKKANKTQAEVGRLFKISAQAVSGWERGTVKPEVKRLKELASFYGVPADELLSAAGEGIRARRDNIPVISNVQAGLWTPTADPFPRGEGDGFVRSDTSVSEFAFALRIKGRSMEKRFLEDDVVIIEPRTEIDPKPRDFVVVRLEDSDEATFKQLWRFRGENAEIRALNDEEFDPIILNEDTPGEVIGVMVEHHGYRRS